MTWSADTWLSLAALVMSILAPAAVYILRAAAKDEISDALASVEKKVTDHEGRLIRLEERIHAMPQSDDFKEMSKLVSEMAGDIKALSAEMHSLHEGQTRTERSIGVITETMMTRA
ncbi:MAG TPA: DUF2730 family protein [Rhizomicrobium sp.]